MTRVYLDNAATSWPKPESVYRAVDDYLRRLGAPAGRGAYAEAAETERLVASCRKSVAQLIGVQDPKRIVFTLNGTDSLNLALHGLLKPGDHVVTTVCEHNSVLRPLRTLAESRGIEVSYVGCDAEGYIDPADVQAAIGPNTRLIAMVHASNVTGAVQPIEEVGQIAAECGVLFLVDAAQSLGHVPVDVDKIGCHLLAAPGHKGLLGPLGTGLLYVAPGLEKELQPIRQGGTGTSSDEERPPDTLPERYEAGNLNVAGIVGLLAGVNHVAHEGVEAHARRAQALTERLLAALREQRGITLYGPFEKRPGNDRPRVGVVSLNVTGFDPRELASLLDANWSIQTRAGLHCAPRMHAALRTAPAGTLRLSLSHFTTEADVDAASAALCEVAAS